MFYSYKYTTLATDVLGAEHEMEMHLAAGVIHQVDILFQDGCAHGVSVQVFRGGQQLWPSNRGAALVGNATIISFREFLELESGNSMLLAKIWQNAAITKDIEINIGLLPKRILQPLSFDELLRAATAAIS